MLMIRLQRVGRRNSPTYWVVVTDSRRGPKSANFVEVLGSYDPKNDSHALKKERAQHWISNGAQMSGTVRNLFITTGIFDGKKVNVLPKKTPQVSETAAEEKKEGPAVAEVAEAPREEEVPATEGEEKNEEVAA